METDGLHLFLLRYCTNSSLLFDALGPLKSQRKFLEDEFLCHLNDRADAYWIVESGEFEIRFGSRVIVRKRGELIGEQAFYRLDRKEPNFPHRGADIKAATASTVWEIDRTKIENLRDEIKSLWHETIARVLSSKLDEATVQRAELTRGNTEITKLIRRFSCPSGFNAASAAVAVSSGRIAAEKTRAIIWFSDLAGFSKFAKSAQPDQVTRAIRRLLEVQAEEIERNGGEIDKFMGDGLMAFWLCPDDERLNRNAHSAVTAALKASEAVVASIGELNIPVDIRVGLHCGEVFVGDFGGGDRIAFTLIGDCVNDASRYEQAKKATTGKLGRIRVSKHLFDKISVPNLRSRFENAPVTISDKHGFEFETFIEKN